MRSCAQQLQVSVHDVLTLERIHVHVNVHCLKSQLGSNFVYDCVLCNDVVAVERANSAYEYGSRFIQAPLAKAPVTALPQLLRSMPPTAAADKSAYSYVRAAKSRCNVIEEFAGWLARCGSCDLCLARLVFRLINKTRTHKHTPYTHESPRLFAELSA